MLDARQADALRHMFTNTLSIVTGPPGSGKTTIIALANIIAARIYSAHKVPIFGVALAGRAASTLQNAASTPQLDFTAKTIHSALGINPETDELDDTNTARDIVAKVLVIDESSMISSALLAAVLNAGCDHVVMLGDADQLPPIGPGAPFTDLIAKGSVPVTRLDRIYRTDLKGIRSLTRAINDDNVSGLAVFVKQGGVAYIEAGFRERGAAAGVVWRGLIKSGVDPNEIAVITPRNVGDEGSVELNRAIREKIGIGASPLQGRRYDPRYEE